VSRSAWVRSAAGPAVAALVLAGCTGERSEPVPTAALEVVPTADVEATHNGADVAFAQTALAVHQQGAELAATALERSDDRRVRSVAAAAVPVTDDALEGRLAAMLTAWGASLPGGMEGAVEPTTAGAVGPSAPAAVPSQAALLPADQVADLVAADDAGFDRVFLELLAEHHGDLVVLADHEIAEGANPQAVELAALLREQHAEQLARVQELLADG
jgi:uncharacterized protein (DUF305 family)